MSDIYMWFWAETGAERRGTDVGRETAQALAGRQLFFFVTRFDFFFKSWLSFEDTRWPEMSLILTVLDKLAYFLSVIAFCVSVSYSWLK